MLYFFMGFDGSHTLLIGIELQKTDLIGTKTLQHPGCSHTFDRMNNPNSFCSMCGQPAWTTKQTKIWTPAFQHFAEKYPHPNDVDLLEVLEETYNCDVIRDTAADNSDYPLYLGIKLDSYDNMCDGTGSYSFTKLKEAFQDQNLRHLAEILHKPIKLWVVNTSS